MSEVLTEVGSDSAVAAADAAVGAGPDTVADTNCPPISNPVLPFFSVQFFFIPHSRSMFNSLC